MSLTIPPLPPFQPQWGDFQVWWQLAKTAIENAQNDLSDQVAAIAAAQAAADAAAADAASAAADAATADANAAAAQTTADSKAKVTRASSAPASPAVNDVWVDSSASPAITNTWNGAAWVVAATEGADLASNVSNNTLANVADTGTRKALASNSVQTSYIQSNAVTNSVSAYTAGSVSVPATSTWTDLQSVTITSTGQPISVAAAFYAGAYDASSSSTAAAQFQWQIIRGTTVIFGPVDFSTFWSGTTTRGAGANAIAVLDQPAAGSRTYKIQALCASGTCNPIAASIVATETKR